MYCKECGTLILSSSKFCQNCGYKLIDEQLESNSQDKLEKGYKEENTLTKIYKTVNNNKTIKLYLGYVAINLSFLLIFSDNIFGERDRNENVFWPFGDVSLGYYDITEFFFYTIVPPLIFYFGSHQIENFTKGLKEGFKSITIRDYWKLTMIFIRSFFTSLFLGIIFFRSPEEGKFDINWIGFLSAVVIGGFIWMLFFGLIALVWNLLKLGFQKFRGKDYSFTFSDLLYGWTNCSYYLGIIIVVANVIVNK